MRNLSFLAMVLALVALAWLLSRESAAPTVSLFVPDRVAVRDAARASGESVDRDISSLVEGTRLPLSVVPEAEPSTEAEHELTTSSLCALRVVVRFEREPDFWPNMLDVRLLDPVGELHSCDSRVNDTLCFSDLSTDTYTLNVREWSSMPVMQKVDLDTPGRVRTVTVLMPPLRSISVVWRASDGRPIVQALLDPVLLPEGRVLEVRASHGPLKEGSPENDQMTFASSRFVADPYATFDDHSGITDWTGTGNGGPEAYFVDTFDPSEPDRLCTLRLSTTDELWLSVWCRGSLQQSLLVRRDETRVVFITNQIDLQPHLVHGSLCLVDDNTGTPVTKAKVYVDGEGVEFEPDEHGRIAFTLAPGWSTLMIVPDLEAGGYVDGFQLASDPEARRRWLADAPDRLAGMTLRVFARRDEPLDLGRIRVAHARVLRFRVLDQEMQPVQAFGITLSRKSSYEGNREPFESVHHESDAQGLVAFQVSGRESYVVSSKFGPVDFEPQCVDARLVSDDPNAIAGTILLRPSRSVNIGFEPHPRPGSLAIIETPTGLPVYQEVLDELGWCWVNLGGTEYKVHLVEDGKSGREVPFVVTSDPCMITVRR